MRTESGFKIALIQVFINNLLEAADGMLMFGVSTAIVISVIQLIVRTRFHDLPEL